MSYLVMAFVMTCEVLVGNYRFSQVVSAKVDSTWEELADTATIELPNLSDKLEKGIEPGDRVVIKHLGYEGKPKQEEFRGYVKQLRPNVPLTLECEDETYQLRKKDLENSWKKTTLAEVVDYIIQRTGIQLVSEVPNINLERFRLSDTNAAQALQKIKDELGLVAYFRGNELYVGLAYNDRLNEVRYNFEKNVIQPDLEFKTEDDVKLKIVAKSILEDNSQFEVEVGDADGERRTIYKYNIKDKDTLKQIAQEELDKYKYTGYRGSLTGWLLPNARHGMIAVIQDPEYPSRAGRYVIDRVVTSFSESGGRRTVYPGVKLSS